MIKIITKWVCALIIGLVTITVNAKEAKVSDDRPLYIIFDGSNSMWGELPDKSRKITVAKDVFNKLDTSMFKGRDVALRLYGHRRAGDCSDTELVVPFTGSADVKARLSKAVNAVKPRGRTPISRSLIKALKDFKGRSGEILLISDGIETCDADPCELVESWKKQNIDIRVHVVGLGLNDMARGAMQCISDASGTEYMDAKNVGELSKAIESTAKSEPLTPGKPDPKPQKTGPEFKIVGKDADGKYLPVKGTISKPGSKPEMPAKDIESNFRYVFEGGDYTINIGVPTASGEIYKPITQGIKVKDVGSTRISVVLSRPPMVTTKFIEKGKEVRGTIAYGYVKNKRDHSLRFGEEHFVMPGTYEYRASLRTDNKDLKVSDTIVDGQDKVIVFNLVETVHAYFKVMNKETEKKLRQHQELWKDGEMQYKIHHANGAKIQPGTYTLKSKSVHTPYQIDNVVIPPGKRQILDFSVLLGKAKVNYSVPESAHIDKKTGKPKKKKDYRCWFYRMEGDKKSNRLGTMQKCNGSEIYFSEGRYLVYPTKTYGPLEDTYFDIRPGETTIVDVHLKK